ncbi:peptidoglycan-binding domain-containing protein [Liberibacter crescens]|uniref:peptidoglycan-binding domain-containing protein n=1 Tax=Liberibacter crescens TaxID=1273132 RepID=UPI000311E702|nr:peptidoglycan-binding domain-containing protein [Liberibacter crescens]AMC12942.1 hypothetical protein RL73_04660 [Liberibacter crescens]
MPEKICKENSSGLFFKAIKTTAQLMAYYPLFSFVSILFFISFGWVTVNALYHQKGAHPSSIVITRDTKSSPILFPSSLSFPHSTQTRTTTFKVKKSEQNFRSSSSSQDSSHKLSLQQSTVNTKPVVSSIDPVADIIKNSETENSFNPEQKSLQNMDLNTNLILKIQKGLSNMAYDNINIDGVVTEATHQAILNFERHYHLPETGQPNQKVLNKLQQIGAL